jgi:hypothetical protein
MVAFTRSTNIALAGLRNGIAIKALDMMVGIAFSELLMVAASRH